MRLEGQLQPDVVAARLPQGRAPRRQGEARLVVLLRQVRQEDGLRGGCHRLPEHLGGLQDDPYRSLVWKLKKEGLIDPAPLIPFHEFRWAAWLRRRPLPPFSSSELDPALPAARTLVRSAAASHLAGWKGRR